MKSQLLSALGAIVAGIGVFGLLAYEVKEGRTLAFDRHVLLAMRRPGDLAPVGPPAAQIAARDITALGGSTFLWMLTALIAGSLALGRRGRMALFLLGSLGSGFIVSALLRDFFGRPRPELVPHLTIVTSSLSFPSGHSMMSAFTYLLLAALLAQAQKREILKAYFFLIAILLALLIGVTRIYLGVHWPTDVLAGWTAGVVWAIFAWMVARWLQNRGVLVQAIVKR